MRSSYFGHTLLQDSLWNPTHDLEAYLHGRRMPKVSPGAELLVLPIFNARYIVTNIVQSIHMNVTSLLVFGLNFGYVYILLNLFF